MKKFILIVLSSFFFLVFGLLAVVFFRPNWILNPRALNFVLEKTHVLKTWSWKEAEMDLAWVEWNRRNAKGHFAHLCFEYESTGLKYKSCLEKISWNFELKYLWRKGFFSQTLEPFYVRSNETMVTLKKNKGPQKKSPPPNIWRYWKLFWSEVIPDLDVKLSDIKLKTEEKDFAFDLWVFKTPKQLTAEALTFKLLATPEGFELLAPKKYPFPKKFEVMPPLHFYDVKLQGQVKKSGIPLHLSGALEVIGVDVMSFVSLPIRNDLTSVPFLKDVLLNTSAEIKVPGVKETLSKMVHDPFRELPAPINAMDGDITINIDSVKGNDQETVIFKSLDAIRMKGGKQVLNLDITNDVPFNLKTFRPGAIEIGIDFHQVALQLPRLSTKASLPQFLPDKRFKKGPYQKPQKVKPKLDLAMHLEAQGKNAMAIRTNLLDELLRFNFDLYIQEGNLQNGYVSFLPLKTKVFRRPVHVKNLRINFDYPKDPVLISQIVFPLPEYKITLDLEGPIHKPRYHFSSVPALSQNDIYSVLLFGRPLDDLDQTDKTSAQKTNQILAQGILSLSVLYFFAGSRVEYIGYNPDSKKATAQFGLDQKTSLSIGRDQEGVNSSGIRRSLGKGWYIDTTVQSPSNNSTSSSKNYGVILERVLAY